MSPDIRRICINMIWTPWAPMKVSIPSRSLPDYPSSKAFLVKPNVCPWPFPEPRRAIRDQTDKLYYWKRYERLMLKNNRPCVSFITASLQYWPRCPRPPFLILGWTCFHRSVYINLTLSSSIIYECDWFVATGCPWNICFRGLTTCYLHFCPLLRRPCS